MKKPDPILSGIEQSFDELDDKTARLQSMVFGLYIFVAINTLIIGIFL